MAEHEPCVGASDEWYTQPEIFQPWVSSLILIPAHQGLVVRYLTAISPVLKQIAGLPKLSHGELKALWREYFGVEPPAYRRGFLVRDLAHRLQELTYGGLKPAYQARLDAMIEGTEEPNGAGRPKRRARQEVNLLEPNALS
jgi:hypothetical protein